VGERRHRPHRIDEQAPLEIDPGLLGRRARGTLGFQALAILQGLAQRPQPGQTIRLQTSPRSAIETTCPWPTTT
jgi:hypothetical protein